METVLKAIADWIKGILTAGMQSVTNWKVFGRKPCIWQVLPITRNYPNDLDAADVRHFL